MRKRECIFSNKKKQLMKEKFLEFAADIDPSTSSQVLWKKIGTLTGKRRKCSNTTVLQDREIAERFLEKHFPRGEEYPEQQTMPITENILDSVKWNQILNRRKKISAPGIDGITYEMLKEIKPDLRDMLITELNYMWRTGQIDQSLKII